MLENNLSFQQIIAKTASAITTCNSLNIEFSHHHSHNFFLWNQNLLTKNTIKAYYKQETNKKNQNIIAKLSIANVDLCCCYLLFCNLKLHQELLNQENLENFTIFDEFEKARLLLLAHENYLGISKNIAFAIEQVIHLASKTNIALLLLENQLSNTANFTQKLALQLPKNLLNEILNLKTHIYCQQKFAHEASKIIAQYQLFLQNQTNETNNQLTTNLLENKQNNQPEESPQQSKQISSENSSRHQETQQNNLDTTTSESEQANTTNIAPVFTTKNSAGFDEQKILFDKAYKIFNSQFDEVVYPDKLLPKTELNLLLKQLLAKFVSLKSVSNKINLKFKQKLLSKKNNVLEYQQIGVLNRKKLSQIVANPCLENIFINHKNHDYQNTTLTLLLDNSGSMRGMPIVVSAMSCQIIASILERFGVKTEIIGFTTVDWKGGKVKKLWEINGRPNEPGRLNQLRHIVYKHSKQSFKKSKINLGLMLKEGLLKENIDGEALLFAKARLMKQPEQRKILVVISDGNPVDDSTNSANSHDILNWHLQKVIWQIEKQQKIEVIGIGIGHDLQRFYKNSITIDNPQDLGNVLITKISDAL
jgi:cobaltochelatase CobT subunit